MLKPLDNYTIQKFSPVKDALEKLNNLDNLILFVLNGHLLIGTITDGDIRRGLIGGLSIDNPVDKFMNTNFRSCSPKGLTPDFFIELKNNSDDNEIVNLLENYEIGKLDINRIYRYIEKYIKENATGTADKEVEEEEEDNTGEEL